MITNKDISIDSENGNITLNGNKYDLGTQGEIDTAVKGVYSVMGEMGAKNLFNSQYSVPRTNAETTATLGDDGHIIINGTANVDAAQLNRPGTTIKPIKNLRVGDKLILSYKVISGTFTHGSSSRNTTLYFNNKNNSSVDPIIFPLSLSAGDSDSKEIALTNECFTDGILDLKDIQIYIRSGDTFNNLELAIMLRLAADTDNTYEPYAMTNKQLTDQLGTKQNIQTIEEDYEILFSGCSDIANRVLCPISFPFSFATADYTLTCSKVELVGAGVHTTGITVSSKYRSSALIILSVTSAAGSTYVGTATIHISRSAS